MESNTNLFINHPSSSSSCCTHDNNNNNVVVNCCTNINDARAIWNSGTIPRIDWSCNSNPITDDSFHHPTTMAATQNGPHGGGAEGVVHALMVKTHSHFSPFSSFLYSGDGGSVGVAGGSGGGGCGSKTPPQYPDPHLMCLKLGKRHYFGDPAATAAVGERQGLAAAGLSIDNNSKRGKPYCEFVGGAPSPTMTATLSSGVTVAAAAAAVAVPRCQVDGCQVALVDAKDYHRRHKVCQMHSKAPKVVVLGLEQRFCQQCSRFHAVSEFDESKRSCRRRLAGHNERRRKSSQDQSTPRNHSHHVNRKLMTYGGRHPHFPLSNGCALSLLSSKNDSWISSGDLPARCSAALRELIAENRASILARQLIIDNKDWQWHHQHHLHGVEDGSGRQNNGSNYPYQPHLQQPVGSGGSPPSWDRISEAGGGHLTLDLMQAPTSAFGFLSVRGKSKEDEECPDLWGSFGGAHVV